MGSEPVFATSFDGTDAVELIYDAILSRVASVLTTEDSDWAEIPWVVQREKNSSVNRDKRYGLLVQDGEPTSGPIGSYDTLKKFRLFLVRTVSKANADGFQPKNKKKRGPAQF